MRDWEGRGRVGSGSGGFKAAKSKQLEGWGANWGEQHKVGRTVVSLVWSSPSGSKLVMDIFMSARTTPLIYREPWPRQ